MNRLRIIKRIFLFCFLGLTFSQFAIASVTLLGTRVIYPESKKFVSLNFRSSDNVPSIMDTWVSKKAVSSENDHSAPFVITPPIFRIDPNQGQSVKLIYTGEKLPSDRESVFYLNFVQTPAEKKDVNILAITYKSTVKVFFRPTTLKTSFDDVFSHLEISLNQLSTGHLSVINNSEYHVTLTNISLDKNGKKILTVPNKELRMIPPFGQLDVKVTPIKDKNGVSATISLINDLGGIASHNITIR